MLLVSEELYMVFEYLDYNLYEVYSKMKEEGKHFTEKEIKYHSIYIEIWCSKLPADLRVCTKMVSFIAT